jgi:hypothetical protein
LAYRGAWAQRSGGTRERGVPTTSRPRGASKRGLDTPENTAQFRIRARSSIPAWGEHEGAEAAATAQMIAEGTDGGQGRDRRLGRLRAPPGLGGSRPVAAVVSCRGEERGGKA